MENTREYIENLTEHTFKNTEVIVYNGLICAESTYDGVKYVLFDPDKLIETDYRVVMYLSALVKDDYYEGDFNLNKIYDQLYYIPNDIRVVCNSDRVNIFVHGTYKI